MAAICAAALAAIAAQTWFRAGTTIGTGDLTPPFGAAWLTRVFEPWVWGGLTLGEPSQLALQLPWAGVLGSVRALGGDGELAQRLWYTILFSAAGLAAFSFLAVLRVSVVGALAGTAVYLLNPYVVSVVSVNPVYLGALVLLAAMPALLVAASRALMPVPLAAALVGLMAPFVGYVFQNPPLVAMVLVAMAATPLVVGLIDGVDGGLRSLRALLLAVPLLLVGSAYWIIPSAISLEHISDSQLAAVSSWSWTETRATIRNALWLNTIWTWPFPEYNPYATIYERAPLSFIKFLLPAFAFGALAIGRPGPRRRHIDVDSERSTRLSVMAAGVAVVVVFLSTGTNPPGNVAFNLLYRLPFGWTLREPGRFLMVASLMYAILVGVLVTSMSPSTLLGGLRLLRRDVTPPLRAFAAPATLGVTLALGFPIYTGAEVPDVRPVLPPAHVSVPGYWVDMTRYIDELPVSGAVLVMPPDDFYQMPYTWGYYGNDGFIVNALRRPVLVPNQQTYSPASAELLSAVSLTADSILSHDWVQVGDLVQTLNTPLILIRGDIDVAFPGRKIVPPNYLDAALGAAPNFHLIRTAGPLHLYGIDSSPFREQRRATPVMIAGQNPDLRILPMLPPGAALVSGAAQFGLPYAVQAPSPELWQDSFDSLSWRVATPTGWSYAMADLDTRTVTSLRRVGTFPANKGGSHVTFSGDATTVSAPARTIISNGDFSQGLWGPVGDCNGVLGDVAASRLHAAAIPSAGPAGSAELRLSAGTDSACESQRLDWHGGPIVVRLLARSVTGAGPRMCIWEFGPDRCAAAPNIPKTAAWSDYRAVLVPDPGTTAIEVFLYADATKVTSINDYANVRVLEIRSIPRFVLIATPNVGTARNIGLIVQEASFSPLWELKGGQHVLVDGLLNGWLVTGSDPFQPIYAPDTLVRALRWISLLAWLFAVAICASTAILARSRRSTVFPYGGPVRTVHTTIGQSHPDNSRQLPPQND